MDSGGVNMAKVTSSACILASDTTDHIRSWAGLILLLLANAGWVRTSDTGQTDLASMPAASVVNTVCGFQIWRMNDSLQATAPVFVKFEFGSGTGLGQASLWVTIGTGTDGAGAITGIIQSQTRISPTYSADPSSLGASVFYGSGETNRLVFLARGTVTSNNYIQRIFLSIERTHASDGSDSNNGLMLFGESSTGSTTTNVVANVHVYRVVSFGEVQAPTSTTIGAYCPSGSTWAYGGNYIGVCPVVFFQGAPINPSKNMLVYLNGDITYLSQTVISCYGTELNWLPLGTSLISTVASSNANSSFLIRWD